MVLTDNRNYLRIHNRALLENVLANEVEESSSIMIEPSKKGTPTLKIKLNDKVQYIHSKYNPEKEAESLIKQINNVDKYAHILFIGTGLGYHIITLLKNYPNIKFSIYEPNIEVLRLFLSHVYINKLPAAQLRRIFTTTDSLELSSEMRLMNQSVRGATYAFTLPVYEKLFAEEVAMIRKNLVKELKNKKTNLVTNVSFQKRWTINSIKNFPNLLDSPNVLQNLDKNMFKGKPAIIVAAGPSLNEEFESLKFIKENGLAYIFSVGSAINALIANGVYPDAACSYDPGEKNQYVFEKIKEKNIQNIPLIFGSSVGYETLENYPGKLLHMITSQDTVSPQLLDNKEKVQIVSDAPSIAVVTFQLLTQLECSLIILVGQNLGYQNNERYASGIDYDFIDSKLTDVEIKEAHTVKDVYGNDIITNDGFNNMRQQLEMYISLATDTQVINTTKGGAQIKGTEFKALSEVISMELTKEEVNPLWYETNKAYNRTHVEKNLQKLINSKENYSKMLTDSLSELNSIHNAIQKGSTNKLEERFAKFDKKFKKLKRNTFYTTFIEPMMRVQNARLSEASQKIRFESEVIEKGRLVVSEFGYFLNDSYKHLQFVTPYFEELYVQITQKDIELKS